MEMCVCVTLILQMKNTEYDYIEPEPGQQPGNLPGNVINNK